MRLFKILFALLLFSSSAHADMTSFLARAVDLPNNTYINLRNSSGVPVATLGIDSGNSTNLNYAASTSFNIQRGGATQWRIDGSSQLLGNMSTNTIGALTNDANDANGTCLGGGGACASTRGASLFVWGNENGAQTGSIQIEAGNVANASIQFRGGGSGKGTIDGATGAMLMTSTIRSSATTSLGWAVVDGTDNTTCESQCTSAAVFGFNLAAGASAPVLVGTTDATADICMCAGAS